MADPHGKFVWYELMTTNPAAAETFYKSVVGWGARDSGTPGVAYTLFTLGEVPVSGLMALPEDACKAGARPGWTGYVWADDVDATLAAVTKAGGGTHCPPQDIPGVGRFAVVSDPQGAVFTLFKGSDQMQGGSPPAPGTPGRAGWHELHSTDWQAAFGFYSALFGWTKGEPFDMGPMGVYQLFATGDCPVGGMMNMTAEPKAPPHWLYYFNVEAIDAAVARVTAAGGQLLNEPMQVPGGSWIVHGLDPQGAPFALVGPRVASA